MTDLATLAQDLRLSPAMRERPDLGAIPQSALRTLLGIEHRYRLGSPWLDPGFQQALEFERNYHHVIEEVRVVDQLRELETHLLESSAALAVIKMQEQMQPLRSNLDLDVLGAAVPIWLREQIGLEPSSFQAVFERHAEAMTRIARLSVPVHLGVLDYIHGGGSELGQSAIALQSTQHYAALSRVASSALDAFLFRPGLMDGLPLALRSAPVVAPYVGARATNLVISGIDAKREDIGALDAELSVLIDDVTATTAEERALLLATLDPLLPDILRGARRALRRREPDYSAHVSVSLRRAINFALDSVAPVAVVTGWSDPRCKIRDDGKGPTLLSRLQFAFRLFDAGPHVCKITYAQMISVEAILREVNGPIHGDREETEPLLMGLQIQQVENTLLWLAYARREA